MQCKIYVFDQRENIYISTTPSGKRTKNHTHASSSQACMHAWKPSKTIPRHNTTGSHWLTPHMPYFRHARAEHSPPLWKLGEKAMIIIQNNFQSTLGTEIHRVPCLSNLHRAPMSTHHNELEKQFSSWRSVLCICPMFLLVTHTHTDLKKIISWRERFRGQTDNDLSQKKFAALLEKWHRRDHVMVQVQSNL